MPRCILVCVRNILIIHEYIDEIVHSVLCELDEHITRVFGQEFINVNPVDFPVVTVHVEVVQFDELKHVEWF